MMDENLKTNKQLLSNTIRESIQAPFGEAIIKLIRPAIRMIPQKHSTGSARVSRFGGLPFLPKGIPWPRSAISNNPYAFLLQLNLAGLHELDKEQTLPKEGLLSFWFNLENWDDGLVYYHKNIESLEIVAAPPEWNKELERQKLPFWKRWLTKPANFQLFPDRAIQFAVEYYLPAWDSLSMELFYSKYQTSITQIDLDETFIDLYNDPKKADHHLLGYYWALQNSSYELGCLDNVSNKHLSDEERLAAALEWKLLLQLDSDTCTDMMWVDGGHLFFFIKQADLKAGVFKHCKAFIDTT